MNRTVQTSRIKLTIFFVTSLFAMTLLIQSTAYGQVPPILRTPRTIPVAAPTPTTKTIVKRRSPLIITGKPTIHPDISNRFLPDLQIADIKYDREFDAAHNSYSCRFYIQVVNDSPADAKTFRVWADLDLGGSAVFGRRSVKQVTGLAGKQEVWLDFPLQGCNLENSVRAVVDATYVAGIVSQKKIIIGEIYAGQKVDSKEAPVAVIPSEIEESDEDNNELVVKIADMAPYTPPAIRKRP